MALPTGKGPITDPFSWQDNSGHVPPLVYQSVPVNTSNPLNGDGRYWFVGNDSSVNYLNSVIGLFHLDSSPATDATTIFPSLTLQNGFSISASVFKFGTGSIDCLSGSATVLNSGANGPSYPSSNPAALTLIPAQAQTLLSSGNDFTLEGWFRLSPATSLPLHVMNFGQTAFNTGDGLSIALGNTTASVSTSMGAGGALISATYGALGTVAFHHFALVRLKASGLITLYIDGVNVGTAVSASWAVPFSSATPKYLTIGSDPAINGNTGTGWVDEVRISTQAQYTANFTPSQNAFPLIANNAINFIGDAAQMTGTIALTWQMAQFSSDGGVANIIYTTDGVVWHTLSLPNTLQGLQSGLLNISLAGATQFSFGTTFIGATVPGATNTEIAVAVTRNQNEAIPWDSPNPFDPAAYNETEVPDMSGDPNTDTLASLRQRLLIDLGFATQAASPPPGMVLYVNNVLYGVQKWLYRKYQALNTRRFFRWKLIPNQRFYSLRDNDDGVTANNGVPFRMDPLKKIEWAGIQDTRNVWYPLIEGIPPQLYTMICKPWRPARYTIRTGIEVYPAPDQTYWLWLKGNFGLMAFAADGDITTLDSELVYLYALARAKAHYGHPDSRDIAAQANSYRGELIAGTHKTAHYVPGTIAVPPAVRPTLIQYQDNQSG